MKIVKFETWWVKRNKCLFDEKRKGKSSMDWDVVVLKLTIRGNRNSPGSAVRPGDGKLSAR